MNLDRFIDETISDNASDPRVLAFPLQCGIGKSSHIRNLLADYLTNERGVIVVTDTISGLKKLAGLPPQDKAFVDYLLEFKDESQREIISYLNANRDRIAFLDHETIQRELPNLYRHDGKRVVLMTTQRYISLSRDEIRKLTSGAVKRNLIVFDEKPIFTEQVKISAAELNEIDTALKLAIDNTANQSNKRFMISYWQQIIQDITELFSWHESQTEAGKEFATWHEPQPTVDNLALEKFCALLDTYRDQLDIYSISSRNDIRKTAQAVIQSIKYGATFTSRKKSGRKSKDGSRYENYLTVVLSHTELYQNVGAQIVVFDGTADISPDYDLDFIKMIDCAEYKPKLNNLSINIVNVNTSKSHLRQSKSLIEGISKDIHARYGNPVIFCHMEQERNFKALGFSAIEHFGNIKGRNEWCAAETIVQVGVNRFPDENYKLSTYFNTLYSSKVIKRNSKKIEYIRAKLEGRAPDYSQLASDEEYHIPEKAAIVSETKVVNTRNRTVVADIEQNLFRGAIRQGMAMTFYLYVSAYELDKISGERRENNLVQIIRERYMPFGAKGEVIDAPQIKINSRKQEATAAQKIIGWIANQPKGTQFKVKDMLKELQLTNKKLQHAKERNSELKRMFDRMSIPSRNGWYLIQ